MLLQLEGDLEMRELCILDEHLQAIGLPRTHTEIVTTLRCPVDRVADAQEIARYCIVHGRWIERVAGDDETRRAAH
jgi:hypothetical protein